MIKIGWQHNAIKSEFDGGITMCEFCECDCWLYEELLPTGRLHLNNRIGIDEGHRELYSTIYDCEGNMVENVRIDIKYCPKCGREL